MFKPRSLLLALLLAAPLACKPPFNPKIYPTADKLYEVALAEYKAHRYDNAAKAFEKLTLDLSARDPRLPRAYYYLAQSQARNREYLLAAGTIDERIAELLAAKREVVDAVTDGGGDASESVVDALISSYSRVP